MLDGTITPPHGQTQAARARREQFGLVERGHIRAAVRGEDRKQRKLDRQARHDRDATREARRLETKRARQKRYRIRMKAKAEPKITMAALAKKVGASKWTLQRAGVRAEMFRRVRLKSAKLNWGEALAVVQKALEDRAENRCGPTTYLENSVTQKWCRPAYPRQESENPVSSRAAPSPATAAQHTDSQQLFACETKLKEQAGYVVWRDGVVTPSRKGGKQKKQPDGISVLKSQKLPPADPGDVTAHRWRKRLALDGEQPMEDTMPKTTNGNGNEARDEARPGETWTTDHFGRLVIPQSCLPRVDAWIARRLAAREAARAQRH